MSYRNNYTELNASFLCSSRWDTDLVENFAGQGAGYKPCGLVKPPCPE